MKIALRGVVKFIDYIGNYEIEVEYVALWGPVSPQVRNDIERRTCEKSQILVWRGSHKKHGRFLPWDRPFIITTQTASDAVLQLYPCYRCVTFFMRIRWYVQSTKMAPATWKLQVPSIIDAHWTPYFILLTAFADHFTKWSRLQMKDHHHGLLTKGIVPRSVVCPCITLTFEDE